MRRKYAVIGLGSFGYWVARTLFNSHQETIAIDMDKEQVQKINKFSSMAVIADVTNKETLVGLGLADCDAAIISLGDHPAASTLATLYLHEMGVKQILVKALDENHAKILRKVGATDIIRTAEAAANRAIRREGNRMGAVTPVNQTAEFGSWPGELGG